MNAEFGYSADAFCRFLASSVAIVIVAVVASQIKSSQVKSRQVK